MKERLKFPRRWLRFPLYILILIPLFLPWGSPISPLLEDGKNFLNKIFTRKDIQTIFYALETHYKDAGCYPAREDFDGWLWETFREEFSLRLPLDRWGEPLIYKTTPDHDGFRLTCRGKDKIAGTADDFGIEMFYDPPPENLPDVRIFFEFLIHFFFSPFDGDNPQAY